jgi:Arc/MetJ-type ribon-helix-helix transcriptional regulator
MELKNAYKERFEFKDGRIYIRLDNSMINELREIRRKTGISMSESIRESIRRLIKDVNDKGNMNLTI